MPLYRRLDGRQIWDLGSTSECVRVWGVCWHHASVLCPRPDLFVALGCTNHRARVARVAFTNWPSTCVEWVPGVLLERRQAEVDATFEAQFEYRQRLRLANTAHKYREKTHRLHAMHFMHKADRLRQAREPPNVVPYMSSKVHRVTS